MPPKEDPKLKLAVNEKNSVVTNGSKDESVKSSQVAAKPTDAQKVINPNDPFAPAEGGAKNSHGRLPTKETAASAPTTEGPQDVDMEDATVKEKEDADRIAELESQLRNEQGANMKMRRTIAEYEEQLTSGSGGAVKSLVERAREIGFVQDVSGKLVLGPPASRGLDYSKPYTYTNRCEQ